MRNVHTLPPQKWAIPEKIAGWRLIADKGPGDHRHRISVTFSAAKKELSLSCFLVSQAHLWGTGLEADKASGDHRNQAPKVSEGGVTLLSPRDSATNPARNCTRDLLFSTWFLERLACKWILDTYKRTCISIEAASRPASPQRGTSLHEHAFIERPLYEVTTEIWSSSHEPECRGEENKNLPSDLVLHRTPKVTNVVVMANECIQSFTPKAGV